jgi:hypothetical protein
MRRSNIHAVACAALRVFSLNIHAVGLNAKVRTLQHSCGPAVALRVRSQPESTQSALNAKKLDAQRSAWHCGAARVQPATESAHR